MGDPPDNEQIFSRNSLVWVSGGLSDGTSTEISYHRLLPGQQLHFNEAMTKELWQVLVAGAVRRLSVLL